MDFTSYIEKANQYLQQIIQPKPSSSVVSTVLETNIMESDDEDSENLNEANTNKEYDLLDNMGNQIYEKPTHEQNIQTEYEDEEGED